MSRIEDLESMLADEPADVLTCFSLGVEYLNVQRGADAARVLTHCVTLKPDYGAAWKRLGDAHRIAGDVAAARAAYEQGMRVGEATRAFEVKTECIVAMRAMGK